MSNSSADLVWMLTRGNVRALPHTLLLIRPCMCEPTGPAKFRAHGAGRCLDSVRGLVSQPLSRPANVM